MLEQVVTMIDKEDGELYQPKYFTLSNCVLVAVTALGVEKSHTEVKARIMYSTTKESMLRRVIM